MKKDFGLVFWLHLALIIIAWSSPLWLSWKLILVGVIALHVQWLLLDGCYLTQLETGKDGEGTFYHHYLSKLYPRLSKRGVMVAVRYVLPILILGIAFIIQTR